MEREPTVGNIYEIERTMFGKKKFYYLGLLQHIDENQYTFLLKFQKKTTYESQHGDEPTNDLWNEITSGPEYTTFDKKKIILRNIIINHQQSIDNVIDVTDNDKSDLVLYNNNVARGRKMKSKKMKKMKKMKKSRKTRK